MRVSGLNHGRQRKNDKTNVRRLQYFLSKIQYPELVAKHLASTIATVPEVVKAGPSSQNLQLNTQIVNPAPASSQILKAIDSSNPTDQYTKIPKTTYS